DTWRLISVPAAKEASEVDKVAGQLIPTAGPIGTSSDPVSGRPSEEVQKLMDDLGALDKEPPGSQDNQIKQNVRRADILEKLAATTEGEQHIEWMKQLSDSIS